MCQRTTELYWRLTLESRGLPKNCGVAQLRAYFDSSVQSLAVGDMHCDQMHEYRTSHRRFCSGKSSGVVTLRQASKVRPVCLSFQLDVTSSCCDSGSREDADMTMRQPQVTESKGYDFDFLCMSTAISALHYLSSSSYKFPFRKCGLKVVVPTAHPAPPNLL